MNHQDTNSSVDNMMMPMTMTSSIQKIKHGIHHQEDEDPVLLTSDPVEIPDEKAAESLFTKSIADMTPSDRECAYDDIHAIPVNPEDDDPQVIQESLEQLKCEIEMREDNQAYLLAKLLNPDYVGDSAFRLLFLRAERFDAKKAAFRMVRHFQIKMELFGKESLGRDIVQDDFDEQDMEVLCEGNLQLLPIKDRGGRAIVLFGSSDSVAGLSRSRRARRLFYLLMLAARDAESYVVLIYLRCNRDSEKDSKTAAFDGAWMAPRLLLGMPIRMAATHLGYDSEIWVPMESILKSVPSDELRVRLRTFQGSTKEWLLSLQGYGIEPDQVPMKDNGKFENAVYSQMLRSIRMKERKSNPTKHIKSPGPFDVLFGKGSRYQDHEGNVKFRSLIADCRKTYDKTKRGQKFSLIQEIVETVKQSSGLFLREDGEEGWIVVDDEAAAKKVGGVFRTMRAHDQRSPSN